MIKKDNIKRLVIFILMLTILISVNMVAIADTGNHTDYYSGDSGSSSSSSSGDGGFIFDIIFILIRIFGIPGAIVILVIGAIVYFSMKGKVDKVLDTARDVRNSVNTSSSSYQRVADKTTEIERKIQSNDELFSTNKFIGWSKEVFITLQNAWEERDWSKIRPFEKEEIFRLHELQLQEYIKDKRINKLDEINVNRAYLSDYKKDTEYEYLTVYMEVRMIDYIIDEVTEKVIKGSKTVPVRNKYLLTFVRKIGVLTNPAISNMSTTRCPNCGAPIQVTSAGKCEYCDFIITTGDHDWVLSNLDSIQ